MVFLRRFLINDSAGGILQLPELFDLFALVGLFSSVIFMTVLTEGSFIVDVKIIALIAQI